MPKSCIARCILPFFAAFLLAIHVQARADFFPEGVLGMKLGQNRVEAVTALVNAGVVPDLDKAQCSENVPEKNKAVADRICKLSIQPGSTYLGHPVNKVSFLFQQEVLVLIGLDVGASENTFAALQSVYQVRWGVAVKAVPDKHASWEVLRIAPEVGKGSYVKLWADTQNAFVVYAYDTVK
jgi:hypothetical protein